MTEYNKRWQKIIMAHQLGETTRDEVRAKIASLKKQYHQITGQKQKEVKWKLENWQNYLMNTPAWR